MLSTDMTRYVELHRAAGFKFHTQHQMLANFVAFAGKFGDEFVRVDRVLDWASRAPSPAQRCNRVREVRRFALAMRAEDARYEVPAADAMGRAFHRRRIVKFKSISDDTMNALWDLRDDVRRSARANDLANVRGSDTVQQAFDATRQAATVAGRMGLAALPVIGSSAARMEKIAQPLLDARADRARSARGMEMLNPSEPPVPRQDVAPPAAPFAPTPVIRRPAAAPSAAPAAAPNYGDLVDGARSLSAHPDPGVRSFGGAVSDAAGPLANLQGALNAGTVHPNNDIAGALLDAARVIQSVKEGPSGGIADAIAQADPKTARILRAVLGDDFNDKISRPRLAGLLANFAARMQEYGRGQSVGEEPISLASRNPQIYNPPTAQARPFEADYPHGVASDADGRIATDIEGRPLTAPTVVGRRTLGAADVALPEAGIDAVAETLPGASVTPVASRILRGNAGLFRKTIDPDTGRPIYDLQVDKSLPGGLQDRVLAHEFGHVHIYTPDEISRLVRAATQLRPTDSLRPRLYATLFGLLAATGLRISEALALQLKDVTADGLVIRQTKFKKSRLVPLHETTQKALDTYIAARTKIAALDGSLFVSVCGRTPAHSTVTAVFLQLIRSIGLRGGPGERGPRLHDIRHSFAVRSLEQCPHDANAVSRHLVALSTYLGHVHPTCTYWYLQATPSLMEQIANISEALLQGGAR